LNFVGHLVSYVYLRIRAFIGVFYFVIISGKSSLDPAQIVVV